jgi:two-component system, LytTR family, response regulator
MQLKVSVTEGVYILKQEDIICLQASSNYTRLYLTGQRNIFSAKTLKEYESLLPQNNFYRVHSSYLINTKHICHISAKGEIGLSQNISVHISKRRKTRIKSLLKSKGLM